MVAELMDAKCVLIWEYASEWYRADVWHVRQMGMGVGVRAGVGRRVGRRVTQAPAGVRGGQEKATA
jgi:hypothetical protein